MKKQGRSVLICRKELNNGIVEMFEVTVNSSDKDTAKKNYESRGYKVSVKSSWQMLIYVV